MHSSDFWYPWYPAIFKNAVLELTDAQELWYRRLIDHYMSTREPLPDSDIALMRISGANINSDLDAFSRVRSFFKLKSGKLYHDFCDTQLDVQDKRSNRRSEIATKAANSRHNKNKPEQQDKCIEHASSNDEALLGDATRQDKTITGSKKDTPIVPTEDFDQFWQGWKPYDMDKGAKSKAKTFYGKARKETDHETIIRKRDEYLGECHSFKRRTQHASTWLNQKRWDDDYAKDRELASAGQSDQDKRLSDRVDATAGFIDALTQD